jgi:hypothetical protein
MGQDGNNKRELPNALRLQWRKHKYKETLSLCDKNLISRFAQN